MTEIIHEEQVYAIHDTIESIDLAYKHLTENQEGTKWYGRNREAIQASRMCYNKHKTFRAHKHLLRPRLNNYTLECFIVYQGSIQVDIYSTKREYLKKLIAKAGDIVLIYRGYHDLEVLEDNSIFFEIKNGPFTTVEEDKVYL